MSPVTYRYKWIIWIHIFCIVVYLIIAIYFPNAYLLLCLSVILLIAPVMALWTFTNRVYKPKKLRLGVIKIISGVMLVVGGVAISFVYIEDISKNLKDGESKLENEDYEKIAYVEETSARLAHIEDDLVNEIDRFYILSEMNAWNLLSQPMTVFEDSVDLSAFKIDSTISSLNAYLIDDNASFLPPQMDNYLVNRLSKNHEIGMENKERKTKFFIPHNPSCKEHFGQQRDSLCVDTVNGSALLGQYYNQLFLATDQNISIMKDVLDLRESDTIPTKKADSLAHFIDFKMGMVNGHIDQMLTRKMHRLYPSCFSHFIIYPEFDTSAIKAKCRDYFSIDLNDRNTTNSQVIFYQVSLNRDNLDSCYRDYMNNLLDSNYSKKHIYNKIIIESSNTIRQILYGIRLNQNVKEKLAATINLRNSKVLKDWVEGMYLPYAQRKSAQEIQRIGDETEWIWKEIKYMGIILSLTTLFLLSLQYLELNDLKNHIISEKILSDENDDKETQKDKIAKLNQKASYLLFPLTTTLTIVAVLLIPVTTKTELVNIEPTKSFRMLQVPSLKLPEAVQSAVSIKSEEKGDSEIKQLRDEINKLSYEIDTLSKALENSKKIEDALIEIRVYFAAIKELNPNSREYKEQLGRIETKIQELKKDVGQVDNQLEGIEKEIDRLKKR